MPKVEIDYSNTVFYKIYCKDPSINELYIGHTTNFIQRKYAHKQSCLNIKNHNYNCKLYDVIRDNNGWDNWRMEIIAFHDCDSLMTAKKYEQVYFEQYKATLNSIEPMPKPKPKIIKETTKKEKQVFYCNVCNIHFTTNKLYEIHNKTKKHEKNAKMIPNDIFLTPQNAKTFTCNLCTFKCRKESEWNRHITTRKHMNGSKKVANGINLTPKNALHTCVCGKYYNWSSGYYRHKKICSAVLEEKDKTNVIINTTSVDKTDITQKLVELIMSKNQEFITELVSNITNSNKDVMEKMMEIMPTMGNNSHNHTNSHNTQNFNIQLFLNEHCKNAMNLTDFIDSLPITASTYDSTIENGLTKTITNMITNGLNKLDILERPIHCTDATRKTIYVKEADIWEKDTELLKVVDGIKTLIRKKRTLICRWKEANIGWDTVENKQIKFTELICNIMTDVDFDEKETGKIVRSISKSVYLDNEDKKKYIC